MNAHAIPSTEAQDVTGWRRDFKTGRIPGYGSRERHVDDILAPANEIRRAEG